MKRIVLLFLLFAFIIGVFLFGVLGLWRMNKENLTQEGLRYHILTKNRADKMGTVSVIGFQNDFIKNALNIPSTIKSDDVTYSVTHIGERAFQTCDNLTSVTIPDSITRIGVRAFANCSNLTNLVIGNRVSSIGEWAFESCNNLKSVIIPDSVNQIQDFAFIDCTNLKAIYFKGQPPEIEERCFEKSTVMYYIKGTPGWPIFKWEGYTTKTWTPEP